MTYGNYFILKLACKNLIRYGGNDEVVLKIYMLLGNIKQSLKNVKHYSWKF